MGGWVLASWVTDVPRRALTSLGVGRGWCQEEERDGRVSRGATLIIVGRSLAMPGPLDPRNLGASEGTDVIPVALAGSRPPPLGGQFRIVEVSYYMTRERGVSLWRQPRVFLAEAGRDCRHRVGQLSVAEWEGFQRQSIACTVPKTWRDGQSTVSASAF